MIARCEEAERKMLFVLKQCENHEIPLERVRSVMLLAEIIKSEAEERMTVSCVDCSILQHKQQFAGFLQS